MHSLIHWLTCAIVIDNNSNRGEPLCKIQSIKTLSCTWQEGKKQNTSFDEKVLLGHLCVQNGILLGIKPHPLAYQLKPLHLHKPQPSQTKKKQKSSKSCLYLFLLLEVHLLTNRHQKESWDILLTLTKEEDRSCGGVGPEEDWSCDGGGSEEDWSAVGEDRSYGGGGLEED